MTSPDSPPDDQGARLAVISEPEPLHRDIVANLVLAGDLSTMSEGQRLAYYMHRCRSLGVDPAEQPFQLLHLDGKLILYATKTCTDALCRERNVSRDVVSAEVVGDLYVVRARATCGGRHDEDMGVVSLMNRKTGKRLEGEALGNAMMKGVTKAKRRAVLSLFGVGAMDETEVETIPGAQRETIEIEEPTTEMGEREADVRRLLADVKALREEAGEPRESWQRVLAGILERPWPAHPEQPTLDNYKIAIIGLERLVRTLRGTDGPDDPEQAELYAAKIKHRMCGEFATRFGSMPSEPEHHAMLAAAAGLDLWPEEPTADDMLGAISGLKGMTDEELVG